MRSGLARVAIFAGALACACDAKTHGGDAGTVTAAAPAGTSAGTTATAGSAAGSMASGVSFARDIHPTVRSTCAVGGCHELSATSNHFTDFTTPASTYTRWVNQPAFDFCVDEGAGNGGFVQRTIVVPGHPEDSVLIEKISSTRVEPCNAMHHPRMPPPPRPPLTPEQIATWTRWVFEGALQN